MRFVVNDLFGRRELWGVKVDAPIAGIGEPAYPAVFATCGGESRGPVHECVLGHTPLLAKREVSRDDAVALHPELVRRAAARVERGAVSIGRIRLTAVVDCARCYRRAILDADDARRGAIAAQRASWAKDHGRWHCPLCLAQLNGTAPPQSIKERIDDTVNAMPTDDLALLHGAVVAELRRRSRPYTL